MENQKEIKSEPDAVSNRNGLHKHTVLIISRYDERINTLNRQIYASGYSSVKEYNCEGAVETLKILKFSVILIDMDIPRDEAMKLIEWLEVYQPDSNVFFINTSGMCHELNQHGHHPHSPISYSSRQLKSILKFMER